MKKTISSISLCSMAFLFSPGLFAQTPTTATQTQNTARTRNRQAVAHPLLIESLAGPVTASEIAAFKAFMTDQKMPPTPWGAGHNAWAFGGGGRNLEALGMMVELTGDVEILNTMIQWADECISQRNDLMTVEKGGQRKMWTGDIDKTWCPEAPNAKNALYSGCETEDTIAHIVYCSKLILQHPELAGITIPDGDPKGYGVTYLDRAKTYIAKCDESNDDYFVKYFIQKDTNLIRDPDNQPAWKKINNNLNAINRQMMFDGGFQRLAECHEILGDAPGRVKKYDAIVKASIDECMKCITTFKVGEATGQKTYDWPYFPWSKNGTESTGHAAYDVLGIYRAFQRPAYGMKLEDVKPIANTMAYVIAGPDGKFAATIDGKGELPGPGFNFGEWILLADWNPDVYDAIARPNFDSGAYKTNANLTASILWARTRREK